MGIQLAARVITWLICDLSFPAIGKFRNRHARNNIRITVQLVSDAVCQLFKKKKSTVAAENRKRQRDFYSKPITTCPENICWLCVSVATASAHPPVNVTTWVLTEYMMISTGMFFPFSLKVLLCLSICLARSPSSSEPYGIQMKTAFG